MNSTAREWDGQPGEDRAMSATSSYVVCLTATGRQQQARQHVGPFPEHDSARRYAERIEQSSNGAVKAHVAPLTTP